MPSSGITAWDLTVLDVCTAAAQELGVVSSGEELTAEELSDCIVRLNMLLKSWQIKGYMFFEATGEVEVPGTVGSGTLPGGIRDISSVRYVQSATNERPLAPWNRSQYLNLPNKAAAGAPTAYYFSKQVGGDILYVWPVPADDITLKIDYSRTIETVISGTETLDIPSEYQPAVIKCLARDIANMFGSTRADPMTVQKIVAEANALETQMSDADRPDSYIFEPYD